MKKGDQNFDWDLKTAKFCSTEAKNKPPKKPSTVTHYMPSPENASLKMVQKTMLDKELQLENLRIEIKKALNDFRVKFTRKPTIEELTVLMRRNKFFKQSKLSQDDLMQMMYEQLANLGS